MAAAVALPLLLWTLVGCELEASDSAPLTVDANTTAADAGANDGDGKPIGDCIGCHTNKAHLIATAKPEQAATGGEEGAESGET